ncbi:hypothetical protein [Massilia sp. CF038]|uniref:hypothetical protein n=1 Tax=Massilia sp. CF038 TaxID=1881045 RepID=UPI0009111B71|nr:hypothetical protein [Massilia sp. CF038]SHG98916.1 PEP-CTERM protein-sorting domain-containing protein [Massilia sp. CF038]
MKRFFRTFAAAMALTLVTHAPASATPIAFDISWSGASFQNNATANAVLKLDDSLLALESTIIAPGFESFVMHVAGAGVGNGTFTVADFFNLQFLKAKDLDLSRELIGQTLGNGCLFGSSRGACGGGQGGEFKLTGFSSPTPSNTFYFEIMVGNGDRLLLTSIRPLAAAAVPEPGTLSLFVLAVLGLAGMLLLSNANPTTVRD